jgi:peptidoglycan/LPS O-acetylase OafA/YrhL
MSIVLVMVEHTGWYRGMPLPPAGWRMNGFLGVRIFFTISGFLITHLLLAEESRAGFVSLRNFYIRRFLRIFPVYFAFLLFLGFL